jgi:ABC transport system ATP-binding/permease protein
MKKQYNLNYNETTEKLDQLVLQMGEKNYKASQAAFVNESLQDLVTNRTEVQKIIITDDQLIQKDDPLYMDPKNTRLLDAPFYTCKKYWFGIPMSTFLANVLVLWGMTILMIVALYYDLLRKVLGIFSRVKSNNA